MALGGGGGALAFSLDFFVIRHRAVACAENATTRVGETVDIERVARSHLSTHAMARCMTNADNALMEHKRMSPRRADGSRTAMATREAKTHARPKTLAR